MAPKKYLKTTFENVRLAAVVVEGVLGARQAQAYQPRKSRPIVEVCSLLSLFAYAEARFYLFRRLAGLDLDRQQDGCRFAAYEYLIKI